MCPMRITYPTRHWEPNTRSIQKLTVLGGLLGTVPAVSLGVRLYFYQELTPALVLALIYVSPYVLVLVFSRISDHAARGGLLLALGLISLVASFSSLAGAALILLPATVVILYASVWSIRVAKNRLRRAVPFFLAALLVSAATIVLSLYLLIVLSEAI